jgi:PKD domain/Bacterial Ig-like domain (group 1)
MMREMRKIELAPLLIVLALLGSAGCAYHNPAQPTETSIDPSVPSQVTLGASPGSGTQAGTATVTARVQNSNGVALPNVLVTFATTRGTISPTQAATGANGVAVATLTASDTADVTASAGALSTHTLVASTGTPTSPPTTPLPVSFLNVSGSGTTGVPLTFSVSSSAIGATWIWSFGDGAVEQSTAFSIPHTYGRAGTYTATVSSSSASSSSATVLITDAAPPPTTPPAALGVTLTCTPATHGPNSSTTASTTCNVTLTYGGGPLPGNQVSGVDWDWGDGTVATADNHSTRPVATHIYNFAGTYTVFATVTANTIDGAKTATTSKSIVVP